MTAAGDRQAAAAGFFGAMKGKPTVVTPGAGTIDGVIREAKQLMAEYGVPDEELIVSETGGGVFFEPTEMFLSRKIDPDRPEPGRSGH